MRIRCLASVLLALAAACGGGERSEATDAAASDSAGGGQVVQQFDVTDTAMASAMRRARASFPQLIARLSTRPTTQKSLQVSVPLRGPEGQEYVWLDSARNEGQEIHGILSSDPVVVKRYRKGDRIAMPLSEVVDWMADDGHRVCGGFTLRVQFARLAREQAGRNPAEAEKALFFEETADSVCISGAPG